MLSVQGLSVSRGGRAILQDISFDLPAGQALILRGPNGAGKTTLLRTLAGLQPAVSGGIDAPVDGIAYAGHSDGLKANLTVTENLQFWSEIFGGGSIQTAIDSFDLAALTDRAAHSLSAGQKRRLGLARLMVTGRPIWVLDEPTVSLDTASVGLFVKVVQAHLAAGGSAIMATHIDLDIQAQTLDITPFKAKAETTLGFDEGFL